MQLTDEQHSIISSSGDIKINAVAGSGKTTTIVEYAKVRQDSKILYIAFNASVKSEAERKFQKIGISNVKVATAHSLAYANVVANTNYKVANYKTHDIKNILGLGGFKDKHTVFILAKHINKLTEFFYNSNKTKIEELNYPDTIADQQSRMFAKNLYGEILKNANTLFAKMWNGEINITHGFYLKKFQMRGEILPYDYILFDEGQDASPVMLDVFTKQTASKIIVGDTHQQIYGWRFAINSLEHIDYPNYFLNTSFRFDPYIAGLATKILQWKKHIYGQNPNVKIFGAGGSSEVKSRAVLARKNISLLIKAIELLIEKKEINNLYFEGGINRYTFADEGASIWDVYNLYFGLHHLIRDEMIKSLGSIEALKEYIEKTDDAELGMLLRIVEKYGRAFPDLLKEIKRCHLPDHEREKADMIFSTVHRCKGMEYDEVTIQDDFITEKKVIEGQRSAQTNPTEKIGLNEEINLLYVAATRTKNLLNVPPSLEGLLPQNKIKITGQRTPEVRSTFPQPDNYSWKRKMAEFEEEDFSEIIVKKKKEPVMSDAYKPWTESEDKALRKKYTGGLSINEIAFHHGRTNGAIRSRLKKLGLITTEKVLNAPTDNSEIE